MNKEDEILEILQQIQGDMADIAGGRLKPKEEPEISGMKIEAKPLGEEEAKEELKKAMEADEAKEGPEGDEESESPETQKLEDEFGIEEHPLPRWKQRLKKGNA